MLGNLLAKEGNGDGALYAYRQAVAHDDPGSSPRAAVRLGDLLASRGDIEGARAAYQLAVDSEDPATRSDVRMLPRD